MTDILELLERAEQLPHGSEQLALTEEAVRLADLSGDQALAYEARKALIDAATFGGQGEKALVAFVWCRAYLDSHPQQEDSWYEQANMLWKQKWILNSMQDFPQFPLTRIQELFADYDRRVREFGLGAGTVPYFRMRLAMHRGDVQDTQMAYSLWQFSRRDLLSDCEACEANTLADYQQFMGRDEQCLQAVQNVLDKGKACAHVPHSTHALALLSAMRLGRWDQAARHHQAGREMVAGLPDHLNAQANHLRYLALADPPAALRWYEQHLPWAEETREMGDQYRYHAASALLFKEQQRLGVQQLPLTLPQSVPGYQSGGLYSVQERYEHHLREAQRLAALFDQRNGTDWHQQGLHETLALSDLPRPQARP